MSSGGIPDDVRRFVLDYIDSVAQLEVLLLVRADGSRDWSGAEVAAELRIDEAAATSQLRNLASAELVEVDGVRFRFAPKSLDVDRTIGELARFYPERRFTIIEIIFSKPSDTIRSFADAFKLKRDPQP